MVDETTATVTAQAAQAAQNAQATAPLADIVVGVDGSDESFAALKWAMREASLTGQSINAVFGWTHSWDTNSDEPDSEESWAHVRHEIAQQLRSWVEQASDGIDFDPEHLKMTSVRASGTSALLQIGKDAQQIVVGRRSLGRVARWFMGSLSASLAETAQVPVTVVRIAGSEDESVTDEIANSLTPSNVTVHYTQAGASPAKPAQRPVVVGVDGSETSMRALDFAVQHARIHGLPLHVMFCWQLRDLGAVPGYETTVPSTEEGQRFAEKVLNEQVAKAGIPDDVEVVANAFHIPASKGLIAASRYASHVVVGSRGLTGMDAHFLGSVSRQIVNFAECPITVVH